MHSSQVTTIGFLFQMLGRDHEQICIFPRNGTHSGIQRSGKELQVEGQPFLSKGGSGRGKAGMDDTLRYNIFT